MANKKEFTSHSEKNFNAIVKNLDEFIQSLDMTQFKIQDFLYKIEDDDVNTFTSFFDLCKIPNKYFSYKDVLRERLTNNLELKQNDTVIFLENTIYIKIFKQLESQSSEEKRACGLDKDVLEEYKNEYFANDLHKTLTLSILPYIVEDILNFRKINHNEFKKLFIHTLVNIFEIFVIENTSLSDNRTIRGLSYHLLRELFDDIMLYISEDILFNFSNNNKKAEEFLSLFNVNEMIDSKGVRHKANPILDESNHAWNMTTIRSIMLQHKKAKEEVYNKKNTLLAIKKKLLIYKTEQNHLNKLKNEEEFKINDIDQKLDNTQRTLDKLQSTTTQTIKYLDEGIETTCERKPLIAKMYKKEDELLSEKTAIRKHIESIEMTISNKQKDIDVWNKKYLEEKDVLASIEKSGNPIDKLYDNIKKALAKTLTKR